jgi:hypothetical protein
VRAFQPLAPTSSQECPRPLYDALKGQVPVNFSISAICEEKTSGGLDSSPALDLYAIEPQPRLGVHLTIAHIPTLLWTQNSARASSTSFEATMADSGDSSPVDNQDNGPLAPPPMDSGPHHSQENQTSTQTRDSAANRLIVSNPTTGLGDSIQGPTGTPAVVETIYYTNTASIAPDQTLITTAGIPPRPTGSPVGNYDINEGGGPSHGAVIAAITVPTFLVFFALIALAICLFRRKQRRLRLANDSKSKEMGTYYSPQQGSSIHQLPRRPTTAARPPVLPALDTQVFGHSLKDQHGIQGSYPSLEEHVQSAGHRDMVSDLPPRYLPRTPADPADDSIIRYEPSHLTEAALTQRHPPDHRSPFDDDAVSQISEGSRHRGDSDNISVVSDISYRGQAPIVEHHMV